ncbi:MAG: extracellular solute-binding protein, partial [Oscillospiraceae bacterium]|nr:extracellular solute-binding protein [Oscillospiraceae bacterium]
AGGGEAANNDPLTKEDVITLTTISHASWPYDEDWVIWDYIEEGTGATLDVNAVPDVDYATKWSLMYSSPETLTDLVIFDYKPDSDKYVDQGACKSFEEMAEYMPNYRAFVETLSDTEKKNIVDVRKAYDGKIYYSPATGRETTRSIRAWMYRKDIFDKHGIAVPTTYDEVYEAAKKLKELYPDSYPYGIRSGINTLNSAGSNWKEYWETGVYYDYNTGKWCYGATEDTMLEVITWYKKMVDEKLCPSDFMTMNSSAWQELVTTDRSFMFPDYLTRVDFFNSMARPNNPEFNLTAFVPPVANAETGVSKQSKNNFESVGFTISNTGDEKRMANAAKFLDWFYTDEARDVVSWGKEGETYKLVNGEKVYIQDEENTQVSTLYGFSTHGTFTRLDPKAVEAAESEDIAAVRDMVIENSVDYFNPDSFLAFNKEEAKIKDETFTTCKTYAQEMITKFILGQAPLSQFDEMVETLHEHGVERLLGAYESAYNRVK